MENPEEQLGLGLHHIPCDDGQKLFALATCAYEENQNFDSNIMDLEHSFIPIAIHTHTFMSKNCSFNPLDFKNDYNLEYLMDNDFSGYERK